VVGLKEPIEPKQGREQRRDPEDRGPEPREKSKVEPGKQRSPFDHEEQLHFLESGAPGGRFSAIVPGWVGNYFVMGKVVEGA